MLLVFCLTGPGGVNTPTFWIPAFAGMTLSGGLLRFARDDSPVNMDQDFLRLGQALELDQHVFQMGVRNRPVE